MCCRKITTSCSSAYSVVGFTRGVPARWGTAFPALPPALLVNFPHSPASPKPAKPQAQPAPSPRSPTPPPRSLCRARSPALSV